jgi:hypothetical protein
MAMKRKKKSAAKKRTATKKRTHSERAGFGTGTVTGRFLLGMDPPENRAELAARMKPGAQSLSAAGDTFAKASKRHRRKLETLKGEGLEIVNGEPTLLLVDVDSYADLEKARELLGGFSKQLGVVSAEQVRSKSGNWHLHIRLAGPLPRAERVLLQGLFGGDAVRAVLDWLWVRAGHVEECFLAEVPENRSTPFEYDDADFGASYGL